jgi:hypothetical protein
MSGDSWADLRPMNMRPYSVSLGWAAVLGTPVSASWVLSRPQTEINGRSTEDEQLTSDVKEWPPLAQPFTDNVMKAALEKMTDDELDAVIRRGK